MGTVSPVGIPREWEVLLLFRRNGKEHGNGLVRMGGNENTIFSHFSIHANSTSLRCTLCYKKTRIEDKCPNLDTCIFKLDFQLFVIPKDFHLYLL